jgi:DedD protein
MEPILKQRLIGAIVLVSLAVISIPIILEGPDDEWTPRSHSIPDKPQMDYRADVELALPPETLEVEEAVAVEVLSREQAKSELAVPPAPAKTKAVEVPLPVPKPVKPPEPARVEPALPAKTAAAAVPETQSLKGWFVQVGSFGQEMNARGLRDRLVAAGYPVRLQAVELGKKHAYRVMVGPSASRADAEKRAASLLSGQQLKGMVIEHPG